MEGRYDKGDRGFGIESNIWHVIDLPSGQKPINCKWIYKVKYHSDGSIERYKVCLVICGNKQIEGFDYTETFAQL